MKAPRLLILSLIVLFTLLQSSIVNWIQIFRVKPDILIVLVIFFSLYFGRIYGLIIGAICGFFSELTSGLPSGFAVSLYSLGGLILGQLRRWAYPDFSTLSVITTTFISTFAVYLSLFFLYQIFGVKLSVFNIMMFLILPASVYTAVVSPFLFRFLKIVLRVR
ncbi:MAG: rod shape-determining protein MreD [Candidatus Omnitrophica bacterium]|nr:rod shape-determining protein MreD [Candidatus Omnitrophota bacterium]